ncbi:MAG: 50S ribosomal protein L10 [ANME-2 cluster archaeon]|nr:50S ribosomal protein L10 [ANME-2 cluster archaeon]MBC2702296.1 50S ribosomal protein L10 [ANME-2 cluster archaeon]MBC2708515.1 50S ribosomal protein L10 [ANME-2 cluster archaeon]MBC2748445.1 50S ribosomal protein L10 [ANME-2 cluster archaeon]
MDAEHHSMHIPQQKKDEIEDIKAKIGQYSVVGLVGIHGMPSKQFQQMRSSIRDSVLIKVSKNSLITRALNECSEDIKSLENYLDHETGLVFSNDNSFKLFRLLESSKTPAPIKGGMKAPNDITVEKRPTDFPPGPIIGELQSAGIPAAIEGGKVVIRETKVVAKKGEVVSQNLAAMLTRLEIFPLELGLVLRGTFEDGMLFDASTLAIDEGKISLDFTTAASQAFNLAVNSAYPTRTTIQALLAKAASESRNLAVNAVIYEPGVMDILLSKAQGHVMVLAGLVSDEALDDDLKAKMGAQAAVSPVEVEPGKEETAGEADEVEEEAAEEETEEAAAEGLGALFG